MSEVITNYINMSQLSVAPSLKDNYIIGVKDGSTYKYNIGTTEEEVNTSINACGIAQFNTSTSYSVGDYVAYNGWAYCFKNAHQGAWVAADASLVTALDEYMKLRKVFNMEKVTFALSYSDGSTGVDGIKCSITYPNGDASISALTDASGLCTIETRLDKLYLPVVEDKSGYTTPTFGHYREITNTKKTLYGIYQKVELQTPSTMNINVSVGEGGTPSVLTGTIIDVFFDTSTFRALTVADGSVNCESYIGATGVIMYPPITGYVRPADTYFTVPSGGYTTSAVYDVSV